MRMHILAMNRPSIWVICMCDKARVFVLDKPAVYLPVVSEYLKFPTANTPCMFVAIFTFADIPIWQKSDYLCLRTSWIKHENEAATIE